MFACDRITVKMAWAGRWKEIQIIRDDRMRIYKGLGSLVSGSHFTGCFFVCLFVCFLPCPWHVEVPGLRIKLMP